MSAQSKCVKCGWTTFELAEIAVEDNKKKQLKLNAVQCSKCGGVVGISEDRTLSKQNKILNEIAKAHDVPGNLSE